MLPLLTKTPNIVCAKSNGKGFRSVAEPLDYKGIMLALAAQWDKTKLIKTQTSLAPAMSPIKVTIEQAAVTTYKVMIR